LLAILGPGLIVMVGDNDAGAFSTYTQAGQDYGTTLLWTLLLWTLLLLVPVLYVNQEMVLRLGAVTGVGHARLILERFGKFWGAFSVIDQLLLNALTIVTEFIGISLALDYLGLPRDLGVIASAAIIIAVAGDFRRFERFALLLVFGSLLLIPVFLRVHPPLAAGVFFAVALIDASVIGAMAVTLSTAYAIGDVLSLRHSLHHKPKEAKAFYAVYSGLVVLAAAPVLTPGVPLGLLTNAVQALAGVLLPSATAFLLLLCNDHAVLGPWVNGRALTVFTGAVIAVLVMLSSILTASVLFARVSDTTILAILGGEMLFAVVIVATLLVIRRGGRRVWTDSYGRMVGRMPPLDQLPPAQLTPLTRIWLAVLRGYLVIAGGLVFWRILQLALSAG